MAETLAPVGDSLQPPATDVRIERSRTDVRRFAVLAVTLVLSSSAFKAYDIEQPAFFTLACIVFAGFAVSYWLPFRLKETFLILLSLGGAYVLLGPVVASLLIALVLSCLLSFEAASVSDGKCWCFSACWHAPYTVVHRPGSDSGRVLARLRRGFHVPDDHLSLRCETHAGARPAKGLDQLLFPPP